MGWRFAGRGADRLIEVEKPETKIDFCLRFCLCGTLRDKIGDCCWILSLECLSDV